MATLRIPVTVDPLANSMTVELDSLNYKLSFRFNARDDHWYVDIYFEDIIVLFGVKVVHTDDLFGQFSYMQADERLPPGTFQVLDITGADRDPSKTDFGEDIVLLYVEAA